MSRAAKPHARENAPAPEPPVASPGPESPDRDRAARLARASSDPASPGPEGPQGDPASPGPKGPQGDRTRLTRAVADPGFTPGRADLADVVLLLADDDLAADAERALLRAGSPAGPALLQRLPAAEPPLRPRIVRVLGRLGPDPAIDMSLKTCLDDPDPKTRRAAIIAIGKRGVPDAGAVLLARAQVETSLPHLRSLVDALGKCGDADALTWLEGLVPASPAVLAPAPASLPTPGAAAPRPAAPDRAPTSPVPPAPDRAPTSPSLDPAVLADPELQRLVTRARLMLTRSLGRVEVTSAIDLTAALPQPHALVLGCRPGLEPILAEELGPGARVLGPGRVGTTLTGPLHDLLAVRLWTTVGLPLSPLSRGTDLAGDITRLLTGAEARQIFNTCTKGQIRYRIAWAGGGHRRALVWRVAAAATAAWPELVNDPRDSTWEVVVDDRSDRVHIELRPRRWTSPGPDLAPPPAREVADLPVGAASTPEREAPGHAGISPITASADLPSEPRDPRFAYRSGDVPAASHPTIAAALARVAGVAEGDIVWDPFVGSGLELCERGRLGVFTALHGTDLDPAALDIAATNLRAAGLLAHATLTRADATTHVVPGVTLIITNPPMGRRVHRGDVAPLLTAFVAHAARLLAPGGRLVWISPLPRVTDPAARAAGLVLVRAHTLDMGGFSAQLQRWERPASPGRSDARTRAPTRPTRGTTRPSRGAKPRRA